MTPDQKKSHLLTLQATAILMLAEMLLARRDTLDEHELKTISLFKSGAYNTLGEESNKGDTLHDS